MATRTRAERSGGSRARNTIQELLRFGEGAPEPGEKVAMMRELRGRSGEEGERLDLTLLRECEAMGVALNNARGIHEELREIVEKLSALPWHPATVLRRVSSPAGERALVWQGGASRLVAVAEDVDTEALQVGCRVYLGSELNVVMSVASVSRMTSH